MNPVETLLGVIKKEVPPNMRTGATLAEYRTAAAAAPNPQRPLNVGVRFSPKAVIASP